ncbi:hypothetical protein IRY61_03205 [Candidatus Saccharibacteria bacterium]|nr:hypothetical protein [Candidatus Saccharibacteria bacterium]
MTGEVVAANKHLPIPASVPIDGTVAEGRVDLVHEPSVRTASLADLDAIVDIEISAFRDVYGADPDPDAIDDVRKKYTDRIELLKDSVLVLERPDCGVYGAMVFCTTNLERDRFLSEDRDMTSSDTIRDIYDPDGKNAYIVNLAIHPKHQGGERFRLWAEALKIGQERGIKKAYFESRLPGFDEWVQSWAIQQYREVAKKSGQSAPTIDDLAQMYWQIKEPTRAGDEKPLDPLLRIYVDFGAKPLKLVKDAWKPDKSSHGYGVLCEYELPQNVGLSHSEATPTSSVASEAGARGRTKEWWSGNWKKVAALGVIALIAGGYVRSQGGMGEALSALKETSPWVAKLYLGSLAAFAAGIVGMGIGVMQEIGGIRWRDFIRHPRREIGEIRKAALRIPNNKLVRVGFWTNFAGAVGADVALFTAIVETSRNIAAAALASSLPAADLAQGVAMRAPAFRAMAGRSEKHE